MPINKDTLKQHAPKCRHKAYRYRPAEFWVQKDRQHRQKADRVHRGVVDLIRLHGATFEINFKLLLEANTMIINNTTQLRQKIPETSKK